MNKLDLIIPVYNGGTFFQECLESIVPHLQVFDTIIVSINKSKTQLFDMKTWAAFIAEHRHIKHKLLIQTREYTAARHSKMMYPDLCKHWNDNGETFFMYLCHNDILLPAFSECIADLLPKLKKNYTVNPARVFYNDIFDKEHEYYTYYGLLAYPDGIQRDNFIATDMDNYYHTNLSGVMLHSTISKRVYPIQNTLQSGIGSEYLMLASQYVEKIFGTAKPIVGIRRCRNAQNSLQPYRKSRHDEHLWLTYSYATAHGEPLKRKIEWLWEFV